MDMLKAGGSQAKDMFLSGAKTMAKVGEYPIHLITNKEVIKYVEKPVGTIKTWMKFVAVMLAASLLLWQLIEKIRSYVDNPVLVNTEYSYVDKLPFPGLIICNSQPLRYSKMLNSPFMTILNETTTHGGVLNTSDPKIAEQLKLANLENLREFYMTKSQPAHDFIVGCKWPSDSMNCSDSDFQLILTDYGPCFRLTIPDTKWPNITAAGSVNSFQIVINVDIDDSFPSTSAKTVGAFIALYPRTDPTPVVSHIGFNAPPGFETSISVGYEYVKRLEKDKDKRGSCEPGRQLALFQNYTTTGCYLQNQFWTRVNACSCVPYNLPDYRNPRAVDAKNRRLLVALNVSSPCDAEQQFVCVDAQGERIDSGGQLQQQQETGEDGEPVITCPDACVSDRYASSLTYSLISGSQLRLSLSKEKRDNITANREAAAKAKGGGTPTGTASEVQYYKENFIILNIYFKELVKTKISQHLQYDGLNFAGDIAGTIGIILGFLLTTLGDVIENCRMLYKKVRGVIDPGIGKIVRVVEKEERIHANADDGGANGGTNAETPVVKI